MCRLFGFKSNVEVQAHHSLVTAENALKQQSQKNADGWGIAYFLGDNLHLHKSANGAFADETFQYLSEIVSSRIVIAHVRSATVGNLDYFNTHPFRLSKWVFAHNGNIARFHEKIRPFCLEHILPEFHEEIKGTTDSEHLFFMIISRLKQRNLLRVKHERFLNAIHKVLIEVLGDLLKFNHLANDDGEMKLNFLLANESYFFAARCGIEMFFSRRKKDCPDRATCKSASPECFGPEINNGRNTHVIFASERITEMDIWEEVPERSIVAVKPSLDLHIYPITLPVL